MLRRVILVLALGVVIAACGGSRSTSHAAPGELVGIFTITGGMCGTGQCEDAMSGVVTLTNSSGSVRRIDVAARRPLDYRLARGRFAIALPAGRYQIADEVSKARAGGSCPVLVTGPRLQLRQPLHQVVTITIANHARTYIRINCFGH